MVMWPLSPGQDGHRGLSFQDDNVETTSSRYQVRDGVGETRMSKARFNLFSALRSSMPVLGSFLPSSFHSLTNTMPVQ